MASRFERRHPRVFSAFVLIAFVLGVFAILVVQFGIPYLLGPVGLLIVVAFDIPLVFIIHRRRYRKPRRTSRIVFGPIAKGSKARVVDAFEKEIAAGFILGAFIVVVYAIGLALRFSYWSIDPNLAVYVLGTTMTGLALRVAIALQVASRPTESERFDTVEDH